MFNVFIYNKGADKTVLICNFVGLMQQSRGTYIYRRVEF